MGKKVLFELGAKSMGPCNTKWAWWVEWVIAGALYACNVGYFGYVGYIWLLKSQKPKTRIYTKR